MEKIKIFIYKIQYISSASKETENIKILTDDPERQKYQQLKMLYIMFQHNRFSKCDTCTLIKTKLGETRDPAQRAILIEKREKHLRLQK